MFVDKKPELEPAYENWITEKGIYFHQNHILGESLYRQFFSKHTVRNYIPYLIFIFHKMFNSVQLEQTYSV